MNTGHRKKKGKDELSVPFVVVQMFIVMIIMDLCIQHIEDVGNVGKVSLHQVTDQERILEKKPDCFLQT